MSDPLSAIASVVGASKATDVVAAESAKATAALWSKVLGPPAEAMGQHFRSRIELWSEDSLARRVLERAARKADLGQPGTVPPRVAAGVFEQAQWAEDEFVAEYLSGVLASSRNPDGKNDNGVSWTALVGRLSADQLRLHYVLYTVLRQKNLGVNADNLDNWATKSMAIGFDDLLGALGWEIEDSGIVKRMMDALWGLSREALISELGHGTLEFWSTQQGFQYKLLPGDQSGLVVLKCTVPGISLFLQAHGFGDKWVQSLVDPETAIVFVGPEQSLVSIPTAYRISDLPDKPTG